MLCVPAPHFTTVLSRPAPAMHETSSSVPHLFWRFARRNPDRGAGDASPLIVHDAADKLRVGFTRAIVYIGRRSALHALKRPAGNITTHPANPQADAVADSRRVCGREGVMSFASVITVSISELLFCLVQRISATCIARALCHPGFLDVALKGAEGVGSKFQVHVLSLLAGVAAVKGSGSFPTERTAHSTSSRQTSTQPRSRPEVT